HSNPVNLQKNIGRQGIFSSCRPIGTTAINIFNTNNTY
ncbi:hypothetical protein M118_3118, partial [Bacteroides fragilis str. 3783N1-2]